MAELMAAFHFSHPAWLWALLLCLPVALWLSRFPSPVPPKNARVLPEDSGHLSESDPAAVPAHAGAGRAKIVLLIALLLLFYVGAEVAFGGWIYTYAVALDLSDVTTAAYLTSAFWGALTVGRLLAIPLATRFRPRSILFAAVGAEEQGLLGSEHFAAHPPITPGAMAAVRSWLSRRQRRSRLRGVKRLTGIRTGTQAEQSGQ